MNDEGGGIVRMQQTVTAALVILALAGVAHAAAAPTSSRALSAKLGKSGRAEAKFVEQVADPLGEPRQRSGSVALESGQRVRLDYGAGEALTLRPDGGEWIQPDLGQLIRLGPAGSEVTRIWQLLVGGGSPTARTWISTRPGCRSGSRCSSGPSRPSSTGSRPGGSRRRADAARSC